MVNHDKDCEYGHGTRTFIGILLIVATITTGGWWYYVSYRLNSLDNQGNKFETKIDRTNEELQQSRETLIRIDENLKSIGRNIDHINKIAIRDMKIETSQPKPDG